MYICTFILLFVVVNIEKTAFILKELRIARSWKWDQIYFQSSWWMIAVHSWFRKIKIWVYHKTDLNSVPNIGLLEIFIIIFLVQLHPLVTRLMQHRSRAFHAIKIIRYGWWVITSFFPCWGAYCSKIFVLYLRCILLFCMLIGQNLHMKDAV